MGQIGGWWLAGYEELPGEVEVWSCLANRTQNWRAVGGKLFLTNQRVVFCPHRFDYVLGGQGWAGSLNDIDGFGEEAPNSEPFSGGLRTRLAINLRNGTKELFVVNQLGPVIERLQSAVKGT